MPLEEHLRQFFTQLLLRCRAYADLYRYVDFDLSMETAYKIKGCKVCTSLDFLHDEEGSEINEFMWQAFRLGDDVID